MVITTTATPSSARVNQTGRRAEIADNEAVNAFRSQAKSQPATDTSGKVMIVDPSIISELGHNFDYANVFIKAAQRAGRKPIILTNKRFRGKIAGCETRPVLANTIYEHGDIVASRGRPKWLVALRAISGARQLARSILQSQIDRLRSARRDIEADWLGLGLYLLMFVSMIVGGTAVVFVKLFRRIVRPFNRDDFAMALAAEIMGNRLGEGDTVVFHTASFGMLESLSEARLVLDHGTACKASAHYIFHMSPTAPDARTYLNRYYQFASPTNISSRLITGSPFENNYFWATSATLVQELETLTGLKFELWTDVRDSTEAQARELIAECAPNRQNLDRLTIGVRASDINEQIVGPLVEALNDARIAAHSPILRILTRSHALTGPALELASRVKIVELRNVSADHDYLRAIGECDLFLAPYPVSIYARRVSGVLADCAMLGVPVFAPAGTTLALSQSFTDVFVYASQAEIPVTLIGATAILAHLKKSGRAADIKPAALAYFRDVMETLLSRELAPPSLKALERIKVAAVVTPLWGRCGSNREFDLQFKILSDLGYFVIQVFLQRERNAGIPDVPHFYKMLSENSIYGRANTQRIARRGILQSLSVLFNPEFYRSSALGQLAIIHSRAHVDDHRTARWLRNAEICVVNHCYHLEFAQRNVGGAKVLDTHDVQSTHLARQRVQNLITRRPDTFEALFKDETRLVRSAGSIVNVSRADDLVFREINPKSLQIYPWVPPVKLYSGYSTVEEWAKEERPGHDWYNDLVKFDMFVGGDSHPANVESMCWFMEEVFVPHLQSLSLRLAVTGRLSDALYQRYGSLAHVFYISYVDNVDDIRALSRIAVLPDRVGAGISNKTIETFSRGMAFSATSFSMRGIADNFNGIIPTFDSAITMAEDIISLASTEEVLQERQALSRQIYADAFPYGEVQKRWDEILSMSLGRDVRMSRLEMGRNS